MAFSVSKQLWASLVKLVKDDTIKPSPTEYPPLLPTLQTRYGMVCNDGAPTERDILPALPSPSTQDRSGQKASFLRCIYAEIDSGGTAQDKRHVQENLKACSMLVTKHELLDHIQHRKRIDMEQAVAMLIAYLLDADPNSYTSIKKLSDDFEGNDASAVCELMHDKGVITMIDEACMWRTPRDYVILQDARVTSIANKKQKILQLLGRHEECVDVSDIDLVQALQKIRRRRKKCNHTQHFTMPTNMISGDELQKQPWLPSNSYRLGHQQPIPDDETQVIPKRRFRKIHRLLHSLQPSAASLYALDVTAFIREFGTTSPSRVAVLCNTSDPFAIGYGFIAAQRAMQLKVVSDHQWTRFLLKGEGALILQNRPDILTSVEDILVRHAHDLRALTAIKCPPGVLDHFSTIQDIRIRAHRTCEFMERYVHDFGDGCMAKLIAFRYPHAGHVRGPVDFYNALCDELRDCTARAAAMGFNLGISPVRKFLAEDIMRHNNSWDDDAFAGKGVPGWVEYLARVRAEEIDLK